MKRIFVVIMVTVGFVLMSMPVMANEVCGPVGTGTPGYWKNHPDAWPEDYISVGGKLYTVAEAITLMNNPVKGDKSFTMFKALVAAKLNVLNGNCAPTCYSIEEVDAWLINFPVGSRVAASSEAWQYSHGEALYWCLDDYNNGRLPGIPSRDDVQ